MLKYLRLVENTGEDRIVTDRNRPVLRVVRMKPRIGAAELFADVRGKIVYRGDVLASTESEWPELSLRPTPMRCFAGHLIPRRFHLLRLANFN